MEKRKLFSSLSITELYTDKDHFSGGSPKTVSDGYKLFYVTVFYSLSRTTSLSGQEPVGSADPGTFFRSCRESESKGNVEECAWTFEKRWRFNVTEPLCVHTLHNVPCS